MTPASEGPPSLRLEIPTLEPEPAFVYRLASLSAEAAPAPVSSRRRGPRMVVPAVALASLATTSWLAGAVPGASSPLRDGTPSHAPRTPEPSPETVVTPTDDGLPGNGNHNGQNDTQGEGNGGEPNGQANGQANGNNGNHNGQNDTQGEGNGGEPNGQANGQDREPTTPKDPKTPKDPRGPKDTKDPKGPKDSKDPKDTRTGEGRATG
jgi:ribonuclease E